MSTPRARPFRQVDVFTTADAPYRGNPVAVVLDGTDLTTEQMQRFAHWTNLSETTFVLPACAPDADYRVRIFTPTLELPFAGHPTLGTCHAWLEHGGVPAATTGDRVVQECDAGLITIHRTADGLAFEAPPLLRDGPVDETTLTTVAGVLRIAPDEIVDIQHADNGPGWIAVLLRDADAVLALEPGPIGDLDIGVAGPHPPQHETAFEVRAFFPKDGVTVEDPVTGGFNASLAQWLLADGRATAPYIAAQGTALGRAGRVHITQDEAGGVRVGGGTVTCLTGTVEL